MLFGFNSLGWCREGGSNPHDRKGRRILSLFFVLLQRVAADRKLSHKRSDLCMLRLKLSLQFIAAKCTKVGNEQPSKQPLKLAPKVLQDTFWLGSYLN